MMLQKKTFFVDFNKNWNENSWKKDVLAKRITNLLSNLSFFFNTAGEEFQIKVAKNLNKHDF